MAVSLSTLSSATTAANALSNLILVSPQATQGYQPQNPAVAAGTPALTSQPPALLFHYEGEQTVQVESDITDHYVEDNTAVQDQIALRPEVITTQGFVGELNNVVPSALQPLAFVANKLSVISAYTPALSATAILAYDTAFQLYQTTANAANAAVSSWNSLTGGGGENVIGATGNSDSFTAATGVVANSQNTQQTYFQQFYGYYRNRTLFTVQTPWAVFQNMAIQRLRAMQDADTNVISDFEVTFKMIRTASVLSGPLPATAAGRLQQQSAAPTNLGTSTPNSSMSVSDGLTQMGVN